MPLIKGSGKKAIKKNISMMVNEEHKPIDQSIAIALSKASKSKPKSKSKRRDIKGKKIGKTSSYN